ncbi:MAG: hypothetical protein ABJZ55_00255 [Fuerstiella sp.]
MTYSNTAQRSVWMVTSACVAAIFITVPAAVCAQQTAAKTETAKASVEDITFSAMPSDQVQTQVMQWLVSRNLPKASAEKVMKQWAKSTQVSNLSSEQMLDVVILSFAEVDDDVAMLLQQSEGQDAPAPIETAGQQEFYSAQVQLFRARWLVQHRFYDDALEALDALGPDDVVDPASLLFYRAICQSELLQTQDALDSVTLLQNNTLDVPNHFLVVADMMKKELLEREEEGMKNVAELMTDVERRLDLGKSGKQTQSQEDAVIAALDKLLEDLENEKKKQQQQQQQQNGQGGQGQQQQNASPSNQSQIKSGIDAKGEADPKNLDETGQWGLLNNKQEAKAREMIQQKFPPNFLDQIGRYTRKIAEQKK